MYKGIPTNESNILYGLDFDPYPYFTTYLQFSVKLSPFYIEHSANCVNFENLTGDKNYKSDTVNLF